MVSGAKVLKRERIKKGRANINAVFRRFAVIPAPNLPRGRGVFSNIYLSEKERRLIPTKAPRKKTREKCQRGVNLRFKSENCTRTKAAGKRRKNVRLALVRLCISTSFRSRKGQAAFR